MGQVLRIFRYFTKVENFCKAKNTTKCIFIFMSHNILWDDVDKVVYFWKKNEGKTGGLGLIGGDFGKVANFEKKLSNFNQ